MIRRKGSLLLFSVFFATLFVHAVPAALPKEKPARSGHASLAGAHIGISKRFLYMGLSGGFPLVKTRFTITNYGDETLDDLQVVENLNTVFGSGNYTHITDPNQVNGEGSSVAYNASFDGNTDTNLLGSGSTLGVGESVTFEIQSRVTTLSDQGHGTGVYHNQVTVTSEDVNNNPTTDLSQDGNDPDPDSNGDPSDNSEVSVIDLNLTTALGIAKNVTVNDNTVTFDFYLENLGTTSVESISFSDSLQNVFGTGNYSLVSRSFIDDPGTLGL